MRGLILVPIVVIGLIVLPVVSSLIINGYPAIANYATSSLFMNNNDHSSIFIPYKRDTPAGTLADDPNNDEQFS